MSAEPRTHAYTFIPTARRRLLNYHVKAWIFNHSYSAHGSVTVCVCVHECVCVTFIFVFVCVSFYPISNVGQQQFDA